MTFQTSWALLLWGNALFSASTLSLSPLLSKKSKVSATPNRVKEPNNDLPLRPYCATIFLMSSSALVILHRPPPVIINFLPNLVFFSINTTLAPKDAARPAAIMPAGPPPTTANSNFGIDTLAFVNYFFVLLGGILPGKILLHRSFFKFLPG